MKYLNEEQTLGLYDVPITHANHVVFNYNDEGLVAEFRSVVPSVMPRESGKVMAGDLDVDLFPPVARILLTPKGMLSLLGAAKNLDQRIHQYVMFDAPDIDKGNVEKENDT